VLFEDFADKPLLENVRISVAVQISYGVQCFGRIFMSRGTMTGIRIPEDGRKRSGMIILSHPTGNEFVRSAALALAEADLLAEFDTCIAWHTGAWLNRFLPSYIRGILEKRSFPGQLLSRTKTLPLRESCRLLALRLKLNSLMKHERGVLSIDAVYRNFDLWVSRNLGHFPDLQAVYAYEDGALETFREASRRGIKCIYDLPIGYYRAAQKIYAEEAVLEPEWAPTLTGLSDSKEKLERKDEELSLADTIIIPGSFVKGTLDMAPGVKGLIKVINFGAPAPCVGAGVKDRKKKLRLLYVGLLTQRKGLSYLFKAVDKLGDSVELTVVGARLFLGYCKSLEDALSRHRWIPSLPHEELLKEMRSHDVLIFPSVFEGFGLVILEAMSQGLPVITTANTAGPDIIQDGVDGFIVPIRSSEAIVEKLELLMDRERLDDMSAQAVKKAALCGWQRYNSDIVAAVRDALGGARP